MTRAVITIHRDQDRMRAAQWARQAPQGTRVEFKAVKRTLNQNAAMWSRLTDISCQVKWHGLHLTPDDWKIMFLDALGRELRVVPNLDGNGYVSLGRSSSDLSKEEMSNLLDLISAFGAQHGVVFNDSEQTTLAPEQEREKVSA